jgi:ketosteroid isomerase-like protein
MSKAIKYTPADTLTAAIALDGAEAARERFAASMLATAGDIAKDLGPLLAKGKGRPGKSAPEVMRAQWVEQYAAGTGCKRPSAVTAVNRLIHCAVIVDKHVGRVQGEREAWVLKVRQAVKAGTAEDVAALASKYVADPVAFVAGRAKSTQSAQGGANVGPNGNSNSNPNVTTSTTPDAGKGGKGGTPDAGKGGKGGKGGQTAPDAGQGGKRDVEPGGTVPGYRELAVMAARIVKDRRNGSSKANPFQLSPEEYAAFQAIEICLANARRDHDRTMAAKAATAAKSRKGGKAA